MLNTVKKNLQFVENIIFLVIRLFDCNCYQHFFEAYLTQKAHIARSWSHTQIFTSNYLFC